MTVKSNNPDIELTGADYAAAAEADYYDREAILAEKFAMSALGAPEESDGDDYADPAALVKLDENFFILELWEDKRVSAAFNEGDFLTLASCVFSAYTDLLNAGEIEEGDGVIVALPFGFGRFSGALDRISRLIPVKFAVAEDVDEEELEEVNGRIFEEYGYISGKPTAQALYACERAAEEDEDALIVVVAPSSPYDSVRFALTSIGQKPKADDRQNCVLLESFTALPIPEK